MNIVAAEQRRHPRIRRQGGGGNLLPVGADGAKEIIEEGGDAIEQQCLQPFAIAGERCFQTTDNIGTEQALRICHLPFGQRLPLRIEEAAGEGSGAEIEGKKKRFSHNPSFLLRVGLNFFAAEQASSALSTVKLRPLPLKSR
jgi:hypothetical protein